LAHPGVWSGGVQVRREEFKMQCKICKTKDPTKFVNSHLPDIKHCGECAEQKLLVAIYCDGLILGDSEEDCEHCQDCGYHEKFHFDEEAADE
jgi:hypothetical protein